MIKPPSKEFHYNGPSFPRVMFVLCDDNTPTIEERLRGRALVNEDAVVFQKRYLDPLGMKREQVGVMWCDVNNVDLAMQLIGKARPEAVVYLGDMYSTGEMRVTLPRIVRARDVWKASYKEEIDRKMKSLRSKLDAARKAMSQRERPLLKAARLHDGDGIADTKLVRLFKSREPERVVYGVVLDPYVVDLQGDWIPPKDVRDTAWGFLAKHGYISDRHESVAPDAQCVESYIEPYPPGQEELAMDGLPHRAFRRSFGKDFVRSGSWIMAVKLSPRLWAQYIAGELDAFSIEGTGMRTEIETSAMPQVTFVDLEAVS